MYNALDFRWILYFAGGVHYHIFLQIFKAMRGVRIMHECALCNPNDSNHKQRYCFW